MKPPDITEDQSVTVLSILDFAPPTLRAKIAEHFPLEFYQWVEQHVPSHRCECPSDAKQYLPNSWYEEQELKAVIHDAYGCPGDYDVKLWKRGEEGFFVLCSCCCVLGDEEI